MDLDLERATAFKVLGRGAMGTVFLASSAADPPELFALKAVQKSNHSPSAAARARWEATVLSRLNHPFLPTLLGQSESSDLILYALPFCPGGDLNSLRYSHPDRVFSTPSIRFYASEIVCALSHLHRLHIVYRDLKPENVLIQSSGHVTLSDFDLSRHLLPRSSPLPPPPQPPPPPRRHRRSLTRARVSPVNRRRTCDYGGERSNSFVGTEEYVSPEVVRGEGHEYAVDWWALGVLTYEMAYGRTPFRGRDRKETFRNVLTRSPEFVGKRRSDLTDLIERLLEKDPHRRLGFVGGAEEVKAHPFFRGVKWEMLAEVQRPPYLPPLDDDVENWTVEMKGKGFDVREYFKRAEQIREEGLVTPLESPSLSLTEF
ncbi:Serine/threonine-protein kinase OXI1 [Acorus gramineus]|uniref:non-specific serine/threonine protein kinase n=1 Tax=Acorus gramineus TaxID=55184 RepID=A0AAV9A6S9_ACOGR|nr:Serine/threonine-protein kinase OXI1 [Acorus gramineus]